jgi:hypothetical protein
MELATEEWIRQRWGGFTYLVLARNEDFMLDWRDGSLFFHYESDDRHGPVSEILIRESATKQCVIDAEKMFGAVSTL